MGDCPICELLEGSYDEKPFVPLILPPRLMGNIISQDVYICVCGQKWWRYNSYYQLWLRVDDEETWKNILKGCKNPVAIGRTIASKNLDKTIQ
jgi:hypothetical protein